MSLLIKNIRILSMAEDVPNIVNSDIYIEDDKISDIGKELKYNADKIIDGSNKIAMPGFINTHTHAAMSIFRGYKDELKLMDWLNKSIFPIEAKLKPEEVYNGVNISCLEMIKTGTTAFCDMYFHHEETIRAAEEAGLRGIVSCNFVDSTQNKEELIECVKNTYKVQKEKNSTIQVGVTAHALYTCSPELIKKLIDVSIELKAPFIIHLAETQDETEIIKERYNTTPARLLYDLGIYNTHTILAHGIYIDDEDINLLKNVNGGISTNPISNCKLASGICDVVKLRNNGINVGIGTDGQGSTTTLDMFEEMRVCAYLQKLKYNDPTIIKAYDILKMATIEGAKVLGLENEIGSIELGKKADIILIDTNKPHLIPENDIATNLVYAANGADVDTVIINGKLIMHERKLLKLKEEKILENSRKIVNKVL